MEYRRRDFLKAALAGLLAGQTGCAANDQSALRCPTSLDAFNLENHLGPLPVYRTKKASGPAIVLLHEMPGMSLSDLALAQCLSKQGFSVFLPLLFGEPGQERFVAGYFQSCVTGEFDCSSLAGGSPIVKKLSATCQSILDRTRAPIGIIGMCLTGALPLALLGNGVEAAVLCQPTLPFNVLLGGPTGGQKRALGLSRAELERAQRSAIPLLAVRFKSDSLCPKERFETLREIFGGRIATIEINAEARGHSTLAGDLNDDALSDAVHYLKVRLAIEKQARPMKLALLDDRPCEMGADGRWRTL
jgi:dienelactone hydrolase